MQLSEMNPLQNPFTKHPDTPTQAPLSFPQLLPAPAHPLDSTISYWHGTDGGDDTPECPAPQEVHPPSSQTTGSTSFPRVMINWTSSRAASSISDLSHRSAQQVAFFHLNFTDVSPCLSVQHL